MVEAEKLHTSGKIEFKGDKPGEITEVSNHASSGLTEEQDRIIKQLVSTIRAYLQATGGLLNGKYEHFKELAPVNWLVLATS